MFKLSLNGFSLSFSLVVMTLAASMAHAEFPSVEDYMLRFPDLMEYNGSYVLDLSVSQSKCAPTLDVRLSDDDAQKVGTFVIDDEKFVTVNTSFSSLNKSAFAYSDSGVSSKRKISFTGKNLRFTERGFYRLFEDSKMPLYLINYSLSLELEQDLKTLHYRVSGIGMTNLKCVYRK